MHTTRGYEQIVNSCDISLAGAFLKALGSGALYWPKYNLLCVSDLHLGKSERIARQGGGALPPYETRDTLCHLSDDLDATGARTLVCLGDSFDDLTAAGALVEKDRLLLTQLQAGRQWIWIEGNHDPGPIGLGGTHLAELSLPPLVFRHVAQPGKSGEISGHYHPKATVYARGRRIRRPAFLIDSDRMILPAYGTYTGGLDCEHPTLSALMRPDAQVILTGPVPTLLPKANVS